jgi:mannitol/fructose-specific phosphotransferase system IIA component (Ntr-type)
MRMQPGHDAKGSGALQLSELIQEEVIKVGLSARDKWEAIEELVDVLVAAHEIRLADRPEVIEAVGIRERSFSTGLKYGLAVPHGSVECVGEIVAALGTSTEGIPFESADGKPARLVILLVLPKGKFQHHVRTLAGVSRLATRPELREKVLSASTSNELAAAIADLDLS